jgi:hypothetical protein
MKAHDDAMELGEEDIIETQTYGADVIGDLAKLADGSGKPRLRCAVEWNELEREEAWVVSLVASGFTLEAIQRMSPLDDDTTTEIVAKLITSRTITMS